MSYSDCLIINKRDLDLSPTGRFKVLYSVLTVKHYVDQKHHSSEYQKTKNEKRFEQLREYL